MQGLKLVFKVQANQGPPQVAVQKKEPLFLRFSREVFNNALNEITQEEERKRQAMIAAIRYEKDEMDVDDYTDPSTVPLSRRLKLIAGPESTAEAIAAARERTKGFAPIKKTLGNLLRKVKELDEQGFFHVPVKESEAPGYFELIKKPMDMETLTRKLAANRYPFLSNFVDDFERICINAMIYNSAETEVYKAAKKMLGDGFKLLDEWKKKIAPEVWDGPAPPDDPLPQIVDYSSQPIQTPLGPRTGSSSAVREAAAAAAAVAPIVVEAVTKPLPQTIHIVHPKRKYVDMAPVPPGKAIPVAAVNTGAATGAPGVPGLNVNQAGGYQIYSYNSRIPGVVGNYVNYTRGAPPKLTPLQAYNQRQKLVSTKLREKLGDLDHYAESVLTFVAEMPEELKKDVTTLIEVLTKSVRPPAPPPSTKPLPHIDRTMASQLQNISSAAAATLSDAELAELGSLQLELGLDPQFLQPLPVRKGLTKTLESNANRLSQLSAAQAARPDGATGPTQAELAAGRSALHGLTGMVMTQFAPKEVAPQQLVHNSTEFYSATMDVI